MERLFHLFDHKNTLIHSSSGFKTMKRSSTRMLYAWLTQTAGQSQLRAQLIIGSSFEMWQGRQGGVQGSSHACGAGLEDGLFQDILYEVSVLHCEVAVRVQLWSQSRELEKHSVILDLHMMCSLWNNCKDGQCNACVLSKWPNFSLVWFLWRHCTSWLLGWKGLWMCRGSLLCPEWWCVCARGTLHTSDHVNPDLYRM